jgi:predicted ATPase
MRIAVSGTHSSGKSTLIEEFLRAHPEYFHEPEPYEVLVEEYGEEFGSELSVDDFYRQLEFNVERLRQHKRGEWVIYERCPVDFLAYILALKDLKMEPVDDTFLEKIIRMVLEGIQHLDLIVFLPLDEEIYSDENPKLRKAVDDRLGNIFSGGEFEVVSSSRGPIVEARGSLTQRLQVVEDAIRSTVQDFQLS